MISSKDVNIYFKNIVSKITSDSSTYYLSYHIKLLASPKQSIFSQASFHVYKHILTLGICGFSPLHLQIAMLPSRPNQIISSAGGPLLISWQHWDLSTRYHSNSGHTRVLPIPMSDSPIKLQLFGAVITHNKLCVLSAVMAGTYADTQ